MLIWRGWGASIFFIFFIWLFVVGLASAGYLQTLGGDKNAEKQWADLWLGGTLTLTAATTFVIWRFRKTNPKKVIGPDTKDVVLVPHLDDLWYVPLQYWVVILLVGAAIFFGMAPFHISPF
jgi:hypothetical protein